MSGAGAWDCLLGCGLGASGAVALLGGAARSPQLRALAQAHAQHIDGELRYLQLPVTARAVCGGQLVLVSIATAMAAASRSAWPLVLIPAALQLPRLLLQRARRERTAAIERQLDTFLLALANALRANPALAGAIAASAQVLAPPLSCELGLLLREQQLGVPLARALSHLAERTGSAVVSAAFAIVRIAAGTGGDLSHTLEVAASSLREMARLEGVVRTKTAEGRAQLAVIAVAPAGLVWMLDMIDPQLLEPLWTSPVGHAVAAAAVALWAAALLAARRILAVDI